MECSNCKTHQDIDLLGDHPHDDSSQNGVSLCKLCHWSFDDGLMGLDIDYKVMISPSIHKDKNFSDHMQMLTGRKIFKPSKLGIGQNKKIYRKK